MSEIKINIDNLDTEIANLKSLANEINSTKIERPNVIGGGSSIQAIENIGSTYEKIQEHLGLLVSDTAIFMQNVRDSVVDEDEKIAQEISENIAGQ